MLAHTDVQLFSIDIGVQKYENGHPNKQTLYFFIERVKIIAASAKIMRQKVYGNIISHVFII